MIQEKHRWTNHSCLFWLPAVRTQFHPSLERGPNIPNSLTSFCLESYVRAFQTECILVATNVIGEHVIICNKCVLLFIRHRIWWKASFHLRFQEYSYLQAAFQKVEIQATTL